METQDGEWILAYLCRRPRVRGRSVLGRETCLQAVEWTPDGWPRLKQGGRSPSVEFHPPDLPRTEWEPEPPRMTSRSPVLRTCYQSLRIPLDDSLMSLTERPGFLRLKGRESIVSNFRQALVARRIGAFTVSASTCVEFEPASFQQLAGLAAFYSTDSFYYLYISRAAHASKCLGLMRCERGALSYPVEKEYPVEGWKRVYPRIRHGSREAELPLLPRRRRVGAASGGKWIPRFFQTSMPFPAASPEHSSPSAARTSRAAGLHADFDFLEYVETDS